MAGDNGKLYMCWASEVATLEKNILKIVAQLPTELGDVTYMTTWQEKLNQTLVCPTWLTCWI